VIEFAPTSPTSVSLLAPPARFSSLSFSPAAPSSPSVASVTVTGSEAPRSSYVDVSTPAPPSSTSAPSPPRRTAATATTSSAAAARCSAGGATTAPALDDVAVVARIRGGERDRAAGVSSTPAPAR